LSLFSIFSAATSTGQIERWLSSRDWCPNPRNKLRHGIEFRLIQIQRNEHPKVVLFREPQFLDKLRWPSDWY
jgi:hypothetical protein